MKTIAQHHQLQVKNIKTHYVTMGNGDTPLLFLHGWGGSTDSFFKLGLTLLEKRPDLRLIILDYPGFGLTGAPDAEGWNTQQYADWVKDFCDEIGLKKTNFYVHSFGARILVRLMTKYPALGDKLIFTGAAGIKWPYTFRQKISIALSKIIPKAKRARTQRIQNFVVTKIFGARDWGNVDPALKATLSKVLAETDLREALKNIQNKSLILWGENDAITPLKSGKIYAENLPNNQFIRLKKGRHGIHHTHSKDIIETVTKFL